MSEIATEWAMNTSQLQTGMLVRRPGLHEELEVSSVKDGKAKIKLPGGKTTTVAATMAIEFRWPEQTAKASTKPEKAAKKPSTPEPEPENDASPEAEDGEWLSDWSLLAAGQTIKVLGETAEFNVLRVTDSSARIKNNSNAQITGLSIGHKFQIVKESATATASEGKGKDGAKSGGRSRKAAAPAPALEPDPEPEDSSQADLDFDPDTDTDEADEIPADIKAEIEHELNGDGDGEEEDEEADELEGDDDDETDQDDDTDQDEEEEERSMPQTTKPRSSTKSPEPAPGSEWITVQQLSDALGCNPPRINTLRAKNKLPKGSWKQDPNDSRRLLYHSSLVEKLKDLAHGKRGGGKKTATRANQSEGASVPRRDGRKAGRPRKAPVSVSKWEQLNDGAAEPKALQRRASATVTTFADGRGSTLDAQLAAAIEHANAQILGLQNLVANLEAQREALRMWS